MPQGTGFDVINVIGIVYTINVSRKLEEGGFIEMLETTIELKKADVPFIRPKLKVETGGRELIVSEVQEDSSDPIVTIRCVSVDL